MLDKPRIRLKFNQRKNITNKDLNIEYGDKSIYFKKAADALEIYSLYKQKKQFVRMYRMIEGGHLLSFVD